MFDETQDPQVQILRDAWEAPAPHADLRKRVLRNCDRELRGRNRRVSAPAMNRRYMAAAALSAAFLLGFAVRDAFWGRRQLPPGVSVGARPAVIIPKQDYIPAPPPADKSSPVSVRTSASPPRHSRPISTRRPEEVVTEFFPLLDTVPQLNHGALLRVTVPAQMVQIAGFPLRDDQINETVEADLLIGEDGTPQAIRFVNFEYPVLSPQSGRSSVR